MQEYNDYPLEQIVDALNDIKKAGMSVHFFQKFTCSKCGSRQTMAEPDRLFASGSCEECGTVTNLRERGCNYMLIL